MTQAAPPVRHHFTVDVEEYFHPTAMAPHFPMATWDTLPRRSARIVSDILGFLDRHGVQATFFIVGWLAEREPAMVKAIAQGGHEVASHGWEHALVGALGPEGFRSSIRRSRHVLEEISGQPVLGYRAPSFSIRPGMEWAFDILLEVNGVEVNIRDRRGLLEAFDRFAGMEEMPMFGWDAVTVPGAVDLWARLSGRFGKLPFENLFLPWVIQVVYL